MLTYDYRKRPNITDLLNHEYFKSISSHDLKLNIHEIYEDVQDNINNSIPMPRNKIIDKLKYITTFPFKEIRM